MELDALRAELRDLQLAAEPDHARIDAFVEQHGVALLGSLRAITKRAKFERGVVTRLELYGVKPTAAQLADPALATVEDLLPGDAHHDVYARFITSPAMQSLRRIEIYNEQLVIALGKSPAPITHIAINAALSDRSTWFARLLRVWERRTDLTSVTCKLWSFQAIAGTPLLDLLTSVTISKRVNEALHLWPTFGKRVPLTIVSSPCLEPCIAGPLPWLGGVELDAAAQVLRGWGEYGAHYVRGALQYLPGTVKRVEVEVDTEDEHQAWARRTAGLFKLEYAVQRPRPRVGYVRALQIRPKPQS